jgi:hypothetical protein
VLTAGSGPPWNELQKELAALSTDSTHIVIENGDHYLQFFQPEVVIDAVEKMVNMIRTEKQNMKADTISLTPCLFLKRKNVR